jgi:hypothetical protein
MDFLFGSSRSVRPLHCEGTIVDNNRFERPWNNREDALVNETSLEEWARQLPPSRIYTFSDQIYDFSRQNLEYFLDARFLATVRKSGKCGLQEEISHEAKEHFFNQSPLLTHLLNLTEPMGFQQPTGLKVVAHFRRGDADAIFGDMRESLTTHPNWYFHIMSEIKRMHPDASLRAFTSCAPILVKGANISQCEQLNTVDVPRWKAHGIELHVDDEGASMGAWHNQTTDEWKTTFGQMANADIFLSARSSFSQSAAYFNPNCVIRNTVIKKKHLPLQNWIEIADPDDGRHHDRSYFKDNNKIAGIYNSTYDALHIRVTGQNPTQTFSEQLRTALASCLPNTASRSTRRL